MGFPSLLWISNLILTNTRKGVKHWASVEIVANESVNILWLSFLKLKDRNLF